MLKVLFLVLMSGGLPVAIAMAGSALVWGTDLLRPAVRRDRIRTVRVETGPLDASLTASGTVVPAIEHVISSPIDARVLAVLRQVGDQLKAGDPIVRLDTSASELEAEKMRQSIAIKGNEQAQTRLTLPARLRIHSVRGRSRTKFAPPAMTKMAAKTMASPLRAMAIHCQLKSSLRSAVRKAMPANAAAPRSIHRYGRSEACMEGSKAGRAKAGPTIMVDRRLRA